MNYSQFEHGDLIRVSARIFLLFINFIIFHMMKLSLRREVAKMGIYVLLSKLYLFITPARNLSMNCRPRVRCNPQTFAYFASFAANPITVKAVRRSMLGFPHNLAGTIQGLASPRRRRQHVCV